MIKLVELNEGTRTEIFEGTFKEVLQYLKDNPDTYEWQLENEPDATMPNLEDVETEDDLEHEFKRISLGWWNLALEDSETAKTIKRLEEELLDEEMDFEGLDDKMCEYGFASELDSGVWDNCLADGNIVYTKTFDDGRTYDPTVQIFFKTTIEPGRDEMAEMAEIKITSVEKF